jgi:hypothetical protein
LAQAKAPLKDAAAVNATRYAIGHAIRAFGLPTAFWSGGRTKCNRTQQGYPKDHFIDAACVGESGASVMINADIKPLLIKATGRGTRQTVRTDKFGFPRNKAGRVKRVHGFSTGDLANSAKWQVCRNLCGQTRRYPGGWSVRYCDRHGQGHREFQALFTHPAR